MFLHYTLNTLKQCWKVQRSINLSNTFRFQICCRTLGFQGIRSSDQPRSSYMYLSEHFKYFYIFLNQKLQQFKCLLTLLNTCAYLQVHSNIGHFIFFKNRNAFLFSLHLVLVVQVPYSLVLHMLWKIALE